MLLATMFSASLYGQNPSGSLRGLVQDASGARVAAASIEIHVADSSTSRRVSSDEHGQFFVQDLPAGRCEITVSAAKFAPGSAEVVTAIGTIRDIVVTLQSASVQQTIGVQAQVSSITAQPIDAASNVHQSVVSSQDLETLPLPARSFADIAYLAPGTEPVEPSDPTKARITAVSTGGSSGLNNELSAGKSCQALVCAKAGPHTRSKQDPVSRKSTDELRSIRYN
jgi:hypothetical protein